MEEETVTLKSMGMCLLCGHHIYEDKTHPAWMACYCSKPEKEAQIAPPQAPLYYDVDC